ncbi:MAG: hypothetical protein N2510_00010 [Ignavibacteria bacterium]|nr:hypothetical protein [Ignavibacteria bacterium]
MRLYTGTFIIALSTLVYEILLTRIFSVTMGYHFAFVAVSVGMFGMTVGAIIVYLRADLFPQENITASLSKMTLYFSITTWLSFLIHISIPFVKEISLKGFIITSVTYSTISIPFIFSGICITLILSRFPEIVNKLYAADLIGAGLGCLFVIVLLDYAGAPVSVFFVSLLIIISSIVFSHKSGRIFRKFLAAYAIVLTIFTVTFLITFLNNEPLIRISWIRGEYSPKPLWEKWNSFSRVSIDGDSTRYEVPFGWGLSNTYDRERKVKQLMMNVDAHSTTVLTYFTGDTSQLVHLKYDVANVVNYLRKDASVLVIGSGAGRDILSSIVFGQKSTLGIEINRDMIKAVNEDFGSFTGYLDRYPNVSFVGDEARSYLYGLKAKFDIIQISVIDDWKATASGTFVLMENALYTKETWDLLLEKLKSDGILTVTRSYTKKPVEHYRLVNLACDALSSHGITDFRKHIVHIRCLQKERYAEGLGTGTLLVSMSPFKKEELRIIDSVCSIFQFDKILTPYECADTNFAMVSSDQKIRDNFNNNFPLNIKSPTDDRPFFFHLMKFTDIFSISFWKEWDIAYNARAVFTILALLVIMILLTAASVIIPLKISSKKISLTGCSLYFIYFASIGLGFMIIEISQIQRLNIFLGHPSLSLSCALFTILISSGAGSYFSRSLVSLSGRLTVFLFLLISLTLTGLLTPLVTDYFRMSETYIRAIASSVILFPAAFFMGTAFPTAMRLVTSVRPEIAPWLWGINGVAGVLATVITVMVSMSLGISFSYWTGVFFYVIASLSFFIAQKKAVENRL